MHPMPSPSSGSNSGGGSYSPLPSAPQNQAIEPQSVQETQQEPSQPLKPTYPETPAIEETVPERLVTGQPSAPALLPPAQAQQESIWPIAALLAAAAILAAGIALFAIRRTKRGL